MASSIADMSLAQGFEVHEALGTTLITLCLSTFIVGLLIVLVGKSQITRILPSQHPLFGPTLKTELVSCMYAS